MRSVHPKVTQLAKLLQSRIDKAQVTEYRKALGLSDYVSPVSLPAGVELERLEDALLRLPAEQLAQSLSLLDAFASTTRALALK